jgi:cell wall assembly regulator SMI1
MNNSMQPVWRRLAAIFKVRYPTLFESLNPPTTVAQLDAFEAATQLLLPTDVRDSYLMHDGCNGVDGIDGGDGPLLFCGYRWSSLLCQQHRMSV